MRRCAHAASARSACARNVKISSINTAPEARAILNELLDKYAEYGTAQFVLPDVLQIPPISDRGNVIEIAQMFGGSEKLRDAVNELQTLLYAA